MEIGVVGSRSITDYEALSAALMESPRSWMDDPKFISGGADGVDTLAERYAERNGIPIEVIEPDWQDWSEGHPAHVRNERIVEKSGAVIALWDGQSNGTRNTIDAALNSATPIYVEIE